MQGLCRAFPRSPSKFVRLYVSHVLFCVLRLKKRVCAVLYPQFPLSLYAYVCHVLFCVLLHTNIGFVQCFFPRSPLKFVRLCLSCYVMRTLPHKRRVYAVLFPQSPFKFVHSCLSRVVLRNSPHKHRVFAVLYPQPPFKFVRLCLSRIVLRTSPHKHWVCTVLFPSVLF